MKEGQAVFINTTLSWCSHCEKTEPARIMAYKDGIYLERVCDNGRPTSCKISGDSNWYMRRSTQLPKASIPGKTYPQKQGCPLDCGPCQWHTASLKLPVFSITNDCNLDCPICFTYNRRDKKYFKSMLEFDTILDKILEHNNSPLLINMTGGEPTLHKQLIHMIERAYERGMRRVTVNTNGIELAKSKELARQLKAAGAHMVLSLDTFDPEKSIIIHGSDISQQKKQALENLEEHDVPTTILPVCIKGLNEPDVAHITREYLHKNFVRSITIQNMTFTGLRGKKFQPREHITIDEVEQLLYEQAGLDNADFFTPGFAHPLCYSAAYYLKSGDRLLSLKSVLKDTELRSLTTNSYFMDSNSDFALTFRNALVATWASGMSDHELKPFKDALNTLYPKENTISPEQRNQLAEQMVKMVYIHPHMDEDNFDLDRVSRCSDLVPDESGRMVPARAYNLLYRQKDKRFWVEEQ